MYLYDQIDQRIVDERVKQFRGQTRRFLAGKLSEDDFRALRLRNGLYIQRYAPMLRIAIPYGLLSTRQLRKFGDISRKFKIAVNGSVSDRAAVAVHDIGLHAVKNDLNEVGFKVLVGGGLGRTPMIGHVMREFLPWRHLLTYLDAVLRVYNRYGRRDNLNKARIKILVKERGPDKFREEIEAEWAHLKDGPATLISEEIERVEKRFTRPAYEKSGSEPEKSGSDPKQDKSGSDPDFSSPAFAAWAKRNVHPHKVPGYAAVTLSLKKTGVPPGDVTADQMDAIAELADRYSFGELRVSHEQNLILADVRQKDLVELWREARRLGLATPNLGLLTNIIACPGGDFCALANAKSIPVAEAIQRRFDDLDHLHDIGELDLNISGCMNACGHHHVGHIGILGVDKNGDEWYQIEIGGNQGETRPGAKAALGKVLGPSFARAQVPDVIERLIECYLERRDSEAERFVDVVHRIGIEPFKEKVYGSADQAAARRHRERAVA